MSELAEWLDLGYPRAYRTACLILRNPADAEEAVQDAFLRAWRFRASAPKDGGLQPWLYRVVVNSCYSKLRKEAGHRTHRAADDGLEELPHAGPHPDAVALQSETTQTLVDALADLPESLRIPVVLRYYAGLSEKEIAAAIHRRPGTVKSRLHEARARLAADPRLQTLVSDEDVTG